MFWGVLVDGAGLPMVCAFRLMAIVRAGFGVACGLVF